MYGFRANTFARVGGGLGNWTNRYDCSSHKARVEYAGCGGELSLCSLQVNIPADGPTMRGLPIAALVLAGHVFNVHRSFSLSMRFSRCEQSAILLICVTDINSSGPSKHMAQ